MLIFSMPENVLEISFWEKESVLDIRINVNDKMVRVIDLEFVDVYTDQIEGIRLQNRNRIIY